MARAGVLALDNVHLTLWARSTLALVGKSGSGKSTLARCLALIEEPDSGEYRFRGRDVLTLPKGDLKPIRRDVQLIFQQAATAMNPLLTALDIVAEPLRIQRTTSKKESCERAVAMLEQVGISARSAHRLPLEFSGGQRQRIAIARALITKPKLLILDEGFSGLDVCTQAQIAKMLLQLQTSLSLSYLFISHDLRMAAYLTDMMAVMEKGRIVETGSVADLFSCSRQDATRELVDSIPELPTSR
ncbi:MAG: dipeptide/oligopeptide/nickel ABC transporter ATP-binding protein [Acidobacteriota bacterium]|nr:dipeptide/oligopeptide/nickel ABC transporter ATP-binding protein [Acidobacteriota bacterium]